jgi:chemotaxis protein MotB
VNKDPYIDPNNSMYPDQDLENVDDDSWQISYLDIITIVLGFLIILLSFSDFTDQNLFSVSGLFKADVEETRFVTTPINKIKKQMDIALIDEVADDKIEIKRELNDLVIRLKSDELYLSGSATINTESLNLLDEVIKAIQKNAYNDFKIEVEGHTDNTPISTSAFPSNWELSTARATNVVKYFKGMGIDASRLKASGYADSQPLVPNEDPQGNPIAKNKAKNRRVDIRLYYGAQAEAEPNIMLANVSTQILTNCQFSVQIGGFESLNNSINIVQSAENLSDLSFDIYSNNTLFSIRTKADSSLSRTLENYEALSAFYSRDQMGLIHQCYQDPSQTPSPVEYQVQLASFINQSYANRYIRELKDQYGINAMIEPDSSWPYKVVAGPYKEHWRANDKIQEFKDKGITKNIFVRDVPKSASDYYFDFQLQLKRTQNLNQIQVTADRISSTSGLDVHIKEFEDGVYYAVSDTLSNWTQTTELFSTVQKDNSSLSPVIYLIEEQ